MAIALVLITGVGTVAIRTVEDDSHPDEWDPRVADLAAYVEEARGLEFEHPVPVDFLSVEEYGRVTRTAFSGPSDPEVDEELERQVAQLRAVGVVSGELDLADVLGQTTEASTLGLYDVDDQRIRVRGDRLTVGVRVTLAHELTHVLQDQHFGIADLLYDEDLDGGEASAALGLIEGDATRIADQYTFEVLDDDERAAYFAEYDAEVERSDAGNVGVPDYLRASLGTPYVLGPTFAVMLANDGGNRAVDEAFRHPPSTEEHLFDPASFLADEEPAPTEIGLDEDELRDTGPFGITQWFLVLAERIDPLVALRASLGWDGDAYASFDRGGADCVRAVFKGATDADEREMADAIDAWIAALPGGGAEAIEVRGRPGFDACDPGPDVDLQLTNRSSDALFLPFLWASYVASAAPAGADAARCVATGTLEGLTYERVSDPDPSAREEVAEALDRRAVLAAVECGSGDR